jgi:broad specificity phosphatase PhoE
MDIILLRHFESIKNIEDTIASSKGSEHLTLHGLNDAKLFSALLPNVLNKKKLVLNQVYVADSVRAVESILPTIECMQLEMIRVKQFCSQNLGILNGKNEREIELLSGNYSNELKLHRCGLFSSYDYSTVLNGISKIEYERDVLLAFDEILNIDNGSVKLFVLHNSSITVLLIYFARLLFKYPSDFYGFVKSDLGHLYWITTDSELKYKFHMLNDHYSNLKNYLL